MKAVILAGGMGARISEEISLHTKTMVEVSGKPVLWQQYGTSFTQNMK